jgi:uroporphyrinogen-III synthase
LRRLGHDAIVAPLLRLVSIPADFGTGPWDAIVMTSANSSRALANHPRRNELIAYPAFVVGDHSAEVARAIGFTDVTSAAGNAIDLARVIATRLPRDARLLYLAGVDRAADLASLGIATNTVAIYRAVKTTEFPLPARNALEAGQVDGVLHYSHRTAEAYLSCATAGHLLDRALAPSHYCLSKLVARPLLQAKAATVHIAERAQEAALIELIAKP